MLKSGFTSEASVDMPLHTAIERGDFTEVCELVGSGADVNEKNRDGYTPLHLLLQNKAGVSIDDCSKMVRFFLEHRAVVDESDNIGQTALHIAAKQGDTAAVGLLLQHGATVDRQNENGKTALHLSAQYGHTAAVKLLVKNGAKVDQQTKFGNTALHLAAKQGDIAAVRWLLQHGATVDRQNEDGNTALYIAAEKGDTATIGLLLQHGATVDQQTNYGETALHIAAEQGDTAAIELLLQHGVTVDQKDQLSGETALHRAVSNGHTAAVKLLLNNGAKVDQQTNYGETVLETAIRCSGRSKLSELLIHEHASRHTDREAIEKLITKACSNDNDGVTRSWCEGVLQKHECSSAVTIEFRDERCEGAPVVFLAVRDLLDRSKPDGFMSKLVSRGVRAKPARNKLEEIIALDRMKDGCSYCVSKLEELLPELEERVLETARALKRFNAYAPPPREDELLIGIPEEKEDEPLVRIPGRIAEKILSYLSTESIRFFTQALSPSSASCVYDSTELCNLDTGVPSLKP